MATYLDPDKVAELVGQPVPTSDPLIVDATDAAEQWVTNRRSASDPAVIFTSNAVLRGGHLCGALLYNQRAQAQGFPGVDGFGVVDDISTAWSTVYKLVGRDPVVA